MAAVLQWRERGTFGKDRVGMGRGGFAICGEEWLECMELCLGAGGATVKRAGG